MENNENFVEQTENVEQTTEQTVEQPVKKFTQKDMDAAVGKAKAREREKVRREYDRKYGYVEEVMKASTGKENVEEATDTMRGFLEKKGIKIPSKIDYRAEDIEVLAKADADNIIKGGYEEVVEEVDRLAEIGVENMTARDKALFKTLAEYRQREERKKELTEIGVTEDVYESAKFKDFAKMFNSTIPIKDIYDIYTKQQPKKEIKTMGSMKSTAVESAVKEYYSPEEAKKFSKAELDKNPALFNAIMSSMTKWK